jgi:hypothetical protein
LTKSPFKTLSFLLLILASLLLTFSLLPQARAETKILSMTPFSGKVGTTVQLTANVSTQNGQYKLMFDEDELLSGTASGNDVTLSFSVPHTFEGNYTVMIVDTTTGENDTATFAVTASYSLETDVPEPPAQRQEGDDVTIFVNITGGKSSYTYNLTVQTPSENLTYKALPSINTNDVGDFYGNFTYPDDFSAGANTSLTGEYSILLNTTLATQPFSIGLTNCTEYHRFQTVDIKAVYKPNENVTVAISGEDVDHSENVTANSSDGLIHYTNWTVPSNASISAYMVNITSISPNPTTKTPPDVQYFIVPGFDVNITTRNLAREPVGNVVLEAFEHGKSVTKETSDLKGLATMKLETGNYSCIAIFEEHEVGNFSIEIDGECALYLDCNLTSMTILVIDKDKNRIPFAEVYVTPKNQTFSTHANGTVVLHSLLSNLTYVLNASRYDTPFNTTTIQRLPLKDWFNITIICPAVTLRVDVADIQGQPLNVTVRVQDFTCGLHYHENTFNGKAVLNCTFGRYNIKTYVGEILLNETFVDLFQEKNVAIICKLYGLTISVRVVDYFGQPISNANVELQREGLSISPKRTESNGIATFQDLIGGNLSVSVYLSGQTQPCAAATYSVEETTSIDVRIGKYVVLAGFLVETSQLTTAIIILAAVILIVLIEVYSRKRQKPQQSSK